VKGCAVTRQGMRIYNDVLGKDQDENGETFYWIEGDPPSGLDEPGTDIGALAAGYVSIHPVHLDLTAYGFFPTLKTWNWPQTKFG